MPRLLWRGALKRQDTNLNLQRVQLAKERGSDDIREVGKHHNPKVAQHLGLRQSVVKALLVAGLPRGTHCHANFAGNQVHHGRVKLLSSHESVVQYCCSKQRAQEGVDGPPKVCARATAVTAEPAAQAPLPRMTDIRHGGRAFSSWASGLARSGVNLHVGPFS